MAMSNNPLPLTKSTVLLASKLLICSSLKLLLKSAFKTGSVRLSTKIFFDSTFKLPNNPEKLFNSILEFSSHKGSPFINSFVNFPEKEQLLNETKGVFRFELEISYEIRIFGSPPFKSPEILAVTFFSLLSRFTMEITVDNCFVNNCLAKL